MKEPCPSCIKITEFQLILLYYCPIYINSQPLSSHGSRGILHGAVSPKPFAKSSRLYGRAQKSQHSFTDSEKVGGSSKNSTQIGEPWMKRHQTTVFPEWKGKLCRREWSSNVKAISSNSKWKRKRKAVLVICKMRKQTACLSQSQNTSMTSNYIS